MNSIPAKIQNKKLIINETTLHFFLEKHDGKTVDIIPRQSRRTITQLAYVHVLFQYIADETGMSKEEAKVIEKRRHLSPKEVTAFGETYRTLPSLSSLDKAAMGEFIERVLADCAFLGIVIPTREELGYLPR